MAEEDVRIIFGDFDDIVFKTEAVRKDDVAAGFRQFAQGGLAAAVFTDVVLADNVLRGDAQIGGHIVDGVDVGGGITLFCFIVDVDVADLDSVGGQRSLITGAFIGGRSAAAGGKSKDHAHGQQDNKKLFHFWISFSFHKNLSLMACPSTIRLYQTLFRL